MALPMKIGTEPAAPLAARTFSMAAVFPVPLRVMVRALARPRWMASSISSAGGRGQGGGVLHVYDITRFEG
jgi:hypothetical protein